MNNLLVIIRCPRCEHIHRTFDYTAVYVFMPETLRKWADLECPECHYHGHEIFIGLVPRTEIERTPEESRGVV